jgi:hypothetical protein
VQDVKNWLPDSPTLNDVTINFNQDVVHSHVRFRTVGRKKINGVHRIVLVSLICEDLMLKFSAIDYLTERRAKLHMRNLGSRLVRRPLA